jgi:hypothetical protein
MYVGMEGISGSQTNGVDGKCHKPIFYRKTTGRNAGKASEREQELPDMDCDCHYSSDSFVTVPILKKKNEVVREQGEILCGTLCFLCVRKEKVTRSSTEKIQRTTEKMLRAGTLNF